MNTLRHRLHSSSEGSAAVTALYLAEQQDFLLPVSKSLVLGEIVRTLHTIPSKGQWSLPEKKVLATPDPDQKTSCSTSPTRCHTAADTPWSSPSGFLVGEADSRDETGMEDSDWPMYVRQLPTRDDFKALKADMKETFKSELVTVCQEVKAIADRVELMEEAHDDTRRYTSQLYKYALVQAQTIQETHRYLEDLDNRGRRNNIRVRGVPAMEESEDVSLLLESIFNDFLGSSVSQKIKMNRDQHALRAKGASTLSRYIISCTKRKNNPHIQKHENCSGVGCHGRHTNTNEIQPHTAIQTPRHIQT